MGTGRRHRTPILNPRNPIPPRPMRTALKILPLTAMSLACLLLPVSCLRDGGFVAPGEEGNLPVLAKFHGKAIIPGTTLSGERMGSITNPKVALVWQFVGPSAFGVAFDRVTV